MKRLLLGIAVASLLTPASALATVFDTADALWKFDHADSGSVTAGQIVDSNNAHDATSIQGDAGNLHWSTTPLSGTSIAGSVDPFGDHGRGLVFDQQLLQVNPGSNNDLVKSVGLKIDDFRLYGPATFRTRLRWDGYTSTDHTSAWTYKNGSYGGGWLFGIAGGTPSLRVLQSGGGAYATALSPIQTDTWYDIAVVIDGAGDGTGADYSFYLLPEGGELETVTLSGAYDLNDGPDSQTNDAWIGGEAFGQHAGGNWLKSFDGTIDYFAIWNRALSHSEVRSTMVPEPSAGLLLAIGLAGFVLGARRRRRGLPLFC